MKNLSKLFAALVIALSITVITSVQAQDKAKQIPVSKVRVVTGNFIDLNGDGFNDNAPDADGDGIPNGQDPDYVRNANSRGHGFIDLDGNGINDYAQDADGDGIPNGQDPDFVRPQDGTGSMFMKRLGFKGLGQFNSNWELGTGECDGTGPKGLGKRIGRSQ